MIVSRFANQLYRFLNYDLDGTYPYNRYHKIYHEILSICLLSFGVCSLRLSWIYDLSFHIRNQDTSLSLKLYKYQSKLDFLKMDFVHRCLVSSLHSKQSFSSGFLFLDLLASSTISSNSSVCVTKGSEIFLRYKASLFMLIILHHHITFICNTIDVETFFSCKFWVFVLFDDLNKIRLLWVQTLSAKGFASFILCSLEFTIPILVCSIFGVIMEFMASNWYLGCTPFQHRLDVQLSPSGGLL